MQLQIIPSQKHNDKIKSIYKKRLVYIEQVQPLRRISHPPLLFALNIVAQLATVLLGSIFSIYFPQEIYYPVSFISSFVRILIWSVNSIYLNQGFNKQLFKYYFPLDLLFTWMVLSCYSYVELILNSYSAANFSQSWYMLGNLYMYCLCLVFVTGNFRVMMYCAEWNRMQLLIYKILRMFSIVTFMYSTVEATTAVHKDELLLLWTSTTLAYLAESIVRLSKADGSDQPYKEMYYFDDEEQKV